MDASRRPSSYDLFKSIVAIILLILFLLLLRRTTPQALAPSPTSLSPTEFVSPGSPATARANATDILETSVSLSLTLTVGPIDEATSTREVGGTATPRSSLTTIVNPVIESPSTPTGAAEFTLTDSLPSPSATNTNSLTETPLPSPTATNPAAPTTTPIATPTGTPVIESTPPPVTETPSTVTACESASARSRLQTGTIATILRRLNFRSSPGIRDNWLRTNMPGTKVEVVGGPECVPHLVGAYMWWQIQLPSGETGWSAEGSIHGTFYFMEPVE